MKKIVIPALTMLLLTNVSCGKKTESSAQPIQETSIMKEEPTVASSMPKTLEEEGKTLVDGDDCLSCHKIDSKLIGPSYLEIAAKYTEKDIDMLVDKIIVGGKGNWGEVPMTPHSGLSKDKAKLMVKYILSLKK